MNETGCPYPERPISPEAPPALRLALIEPDIAPNVGTLIRLGACLGVPIDVVEPCGFAFSDRPYRRAALDYEPLAEVARHVSWPRFVDAMGARRLVLATTKAEARLDRFAFKEGDVVMLGRESAGAPAAVHARADASVRIPLRGHARSLNVALAGAMILSEGLRQLGRFPADPPRG